MALRNLTKIYNDYRDEYYKSSSGGRLISEDREYIFGSNLV